MTEKNQVKVFHTWCGIYLAAGRSTHCK